jgi:hypothetical protein
MADSKEINEESKYAQPVQPDPLAAMVSSGRVIVTAQADLQHPDRKIELKEVSPPPGFVNHFQVSEAHTRTRLRVRQNALAKAAGKIQAEADKEIDKIRAEYDQKINAHKADFVAVTTKRRDEVLNRTLKELDEAVKDLKQISWIQCGLGMVLIGVIYVLTQYQSLSKCKF